MNIVNQLARPLDGFRHRAIVASGPLGRRLVRDRELRIRLSFGLTLSVVMTLVLYAPAWPLALSPILLGVPHVLGDLRYLWFRPQRHRKLLFNLIAFPLLAIGGGSGMVGFAFLAATLIVLIAPGPVVRRMLAAILFGTVGILCAVFPRPAALVFAHGHNVIGIALFLAWRPRGRSELAAFLVPLGVMLAILWLPSTHSYLQQSGALDRSVGNVEFYDVGALMLGSLHVSLLVPLTLSFALLQGVHYGVWLRFIPEEDRGASTSRTFRRTFLALRRDLGVAVLALSGFAMVAVMAWAFVDLGAARSGYLRAASFHGQLELVALALLIAEGRPARWTAKEEARSSDSFVWRPASIR